MRTFDADTWVALLCLLLGYVSLGSGVFSALAGYQALGVAGFAGCALLIVAAIAIGIRRANRERRQDAARDDLLLQLAREGTLDERVREAKQRATA